DPMGRDKPEGTVEVPDRGGGCHGVDTTGERIDFGRDKERDLEPKIALQHRRAVWELAGDLAPRFGRECCPATPGEAGGDRAQEQAAGLEELPAGPPLVVVVMKEVRRANSHVVSTHRRPAVFRCHRMAPFLA